MNNKFLDKIKEEYKMIKTPERLKAGGWYALQAEIQQKRRGVFVNIWMNKLFLATTLFLIIFGSVWGGIKTVAASMPGTFLYPVKLFGENLVETTTGDATHALENRKDEIINLVDEKEKNEEVLEEVVREYAKKVESEKREIEEHAKESQKTKFEQKLEEHHEEFEEVRKNNSLSEDDLKKVLEVTKKDSDDDHEDDHNEGGDHED